MPAISFNAIHQADKKKAQEEEMFGKLKLEPISSADN